MNKVKVADFITFIKSKISFVMYLEIFQNNQVMGM